MLIYIYGGSAWGYFQHLPTNPCFHTIPSKAILHPSCHQHFLAWRAHHCTLQSPWCRAMSLQRWSWWPQVMGCWKVLGPTSTILAYLPSPNCKTFYGENTCVGIPNVQVWRQGICSIIPWKRSTNYTSCGVMAMQSLTLTGLRTGCSPWSMNIGGRAYCNSGLSPNMPGWISWNNVSCLP